MIADSGPVDVQPPANLAPILPPGNGPPSPTSRPGADFKIQQGAAVIRNGSCLPDVEFDCARDVFTPLSSCCPSRLTCQGTKHFRCCPPRSDCAPERLCANSSWALYELKEYFCCAEGTQGYNINGYGLCAEPGAPALEGKPFLPELSVDATATPSLSPPLSEGPISSASRSNAAIVGGILGAIVGFAIIVRVSLVIIRQRRRSRVKILRAEEDRSGGTGDENRGHAKDDEDFDTSLMSRQNLDKELLSQPASFELQWTTIQSPRSGGSAKS